jgi:hypothetical protein
LDLCGRGLPFREESHHAGEQLHTSIKSIVRNVSIYTQKDKCILIEKLRKDNNAMQKGKRTRKERRKHLKGKRTFKTKKK